MEALEQQQEQTNPIATSLELSISSDEEEAEDTKDEHPGAPQEPPPESQTKQLKSPKTLSKHEDIQLQYDDKILQTTTTATKAEKTDALDNIQQEQQQHQYIANGDISATNKALNNDAVSSEDTTTEQHSENAQHNVSSSPNDIASRTLNSSIHIDEAQYSESSPAQDFLDNEIQQQSLPNDIESRTLNSSIHFHEAQYSTSVPAQDFVDNEMQQQSSPSQDDITLEPMVEETSDGVDAASKPFSTQTTIDNDNDVQKRGPLEALVSTKLMSKDDACMSIQSSRDVENFSLLFNAHNPTVKEETQILLSDVKQQATEVKEEVSTTNAFDTVVPKEERRSPLLNINTNDTTFEFSDDDSLSDSVQNSSSDYESVLDAVSPKANLTEEPENVTTAEKRDLDSCSDAHKIDTKTTEELVGTVDNATEAIALTQAYHINKNHCDIISKPGEVSSIKDINELDNTERPLLNGDHNVQQNSETTHLNTQTVEDTHSNLTVIQTHEGDTHEPEPALDLHSSNHSIDENSDKESIHSAEENSICLSETDHESLHHSEEDSHSSVAASDAASLSSTSSSQQLVIDHPMEETAKVAPLKLSLKRKYNSTNYEEEEPLVKRFVLNTPESTKVENDDDENILSQESENSQSKSLLLQRLEQPLPPTPTPVHIKQTNETPNNTLSTASSAYYKSSDYSETSFISQQALNARGAISNAEHRILEGTQQTTAIQNDVEAVQKHKQKLYRCAICTCVHEKWSFFNHVRDKHNRYICLYCLRLYRTAEKLSLHLENKHDLEQKHYNTAFDWCDKTTQDESEQRTLTCCMCQHVFKPSDPSFLEHNCSEFIQPCDLCKLRGRHTNDCKNNTRKKRDRNGTVKKTLKRKIKPVMLPAHDPTPTPTPAPPPPPPRASPPQEPSPAIEVQYPAAAAYAMARQRRVSISKVISIEEIRNEQVTETTDNSNALPVAVETWNSDDNIHKEAELNTNTNTNTTCDATQSNGLEPCIPKLVIPKIMLRVPKEFQKSVDAELSSIESDDFDDDEEEEEVEEEEQETEREWNSSATAENVDEEQVNVTRERAPTLDMDTNSATETATETSMLNESIATPSIHHEQTDMQNSDEDSVDSTNANLTRILDEIERTKMEIRRTQVKTMSKQDSYANNQCSSVAAATGAAAPATEQRWSPTPPASPHTRCYTPGRRAAALPDNAVGEIVDSTKLATDVENVADDNLLKMRRDTEGSDAMDIDNTICNNTTDENNATNESNAEISIYKPDNDDDDNIELNNVAKLPIVASESNEQNAVEDFMHDDASRSSNVDITDIATTPPRPVSEPPADGIEVANEDVLAVELQLDRPIDKFEIVDFVRLCLKSVYPLCLYCNHARRIAVNAKSLVLHMIAQHRFTATVDSITAEELQVETIVSKLKSYLPLLETEYLNSSSYCTLGDGAFTRPFNERIYECFQCRFVTSTHKELYMHNRRLHLKTPILCFMCRSNFYSFSEILCHICPGESTKTSIFDVKYRCCLCEVTNLPSPFRLMVHLRKKHFACDICLEDCHDQSKLSSHVWKHKLHHLCYRCGIAYRNKQDITKHLYWKHGTESINCKRCLQKRWRHVYHFCVPPTSFVCEVCQISFTKAMYLEVHKRLHSGDLRYPCAEEQCEEKFVSRRLLLKHTAKQHALPVGDITEVKSVDLSDLDSSLTENIKQHANENIENTEIKKESFVEAEEKNNETLNNEVTDAEATKDTKLDAKDTSDVNAETPRKKRKKNKRQKESLEDLNLIAPNLSESDSSDESDATIVEYAKPKCEDTALHLPKVMLSPASESDDELSAIKSKQDDTVNISSQLNEVPDIWKSLLQANASDTPALTPNEETSLAEKPQKKETEMLDEYATPKHLHVSVSDHDYCVMHKPPPPPMATPNKNSINKKSLSKSARKALKTAAGNRAKNDSNDFSSDSSSESSSSSDSSSCSCGSNCSCSSSGSDSGSSSSSSSDDSDSSNATSNASPSKKQRKKSVRKKSVSPQKHAAHKNAASVNNTPDKETGEQINVTEEEVCAPPLPQPSPTPKAASFNESDFETAESETDEEFYDEHPQKLANELLAQKRAALMAQTRLSPSHNFDIVENSRPSTPSLPEEATTYGDKRSKQKKKKRERKSTNSKSANQKSITNIAENVFTATPNIVPAAVTAAPLPDPNAFTFNTTIMPNVTQPINQSLIMPTYTSTPLATQPIYANHALNNTMDDAFTPVRPLAHLAANLPTKQLASEGSSCSDADANLKRSKRARRPNRFYGYSSDDENMSSVLQPPLMVGLQLIKPQPPPQLTWAKEDLPAPSKSILNNKNKVARNPKTPTLTTTNAAGGLLNNSTNQTSRKRIRRPPGGGGGGVGERGARKRANKKPKKENNTTSAAPGVATTVGMPPIPTLKIRPSELPAMNNNSDDSSEYSTDNETEVINVTGEPSTSAAGVWNTAASSTMNFTNPISHILSQMPQQQQQHGNILQTATPILPAAAASVAAVTTAAAVAPVLLPPVPETTVFKQKIPPALLPNPDFATLQYFKANNIRYPIRPPAGARLAREGEAVYCYCRCPYDEVSEMIACDGDNCLIEWFHFECVGIMVAPQGKWFCAECRPKYSEELYPTSKI